MKILLINSPPDSRITKEGRVIIPLNITLESSRFPLSLALIAGAVRKRGVETKICDLGPGRRSWRMLEKTLMRFRPDISIVNVSTPTLHTDRMGAALAGATGSAVILFGQHAQAWPEKTLEEVPEADAAVFGEPEPSITALLEAHAENSAFGSRNVRGGGKTKVLYTENNRKKQKVAGGAFKALSQSVPPGIAIRKGDEIARGPARGWCGLDDLCLPARDILPPSIYRLPDGKPYTLVLASRGCPYACPFCLATFMNGKIHRKRSADSIVDEISSIVKNSGVRDFLFQSDLFTCDSGWIRELCEGILKAELKIRWICNSRIDTLNKEVLELMARAGCFLMSIGIETGDNTLLKKMHKNPDIDMIKETVRNATDAGILVNGSFVVGFPGETHETLGRTADLIRELPLAFLVLMCATPFPGTPLYERLENERGFINMDYRNFSFDKYIIDGEVEPATIYSFIRDELRRFYLRPRYIAGMLKAARKPDIAASYIAYGLKRGKQIAGAFRNGRTIRHNSGP